MAVAGAPQTRVHLVLGSGGARTLAYVGALEVLAEAGIGFESISACSAGSLIGALVATGLPMREVQARVEAVDLRRLLGKPSLPGPLRYVSWLRWPFAPYDSDAVVQIMEDLIGPGKTFGEMAIPFATAGIDLLSKQLLVYASETHADMKVTEAVRIAVGIPLFFPPHEAQFFRGLGLHVHAIRRNSEIVGDRHDHARDVRSHFRPLRVDRGIHVHDAPAGGGEPVPDGAQEDAAVRAEVARVRVREKPPDVAHRRCLRQGLDLLGVVQSKFGIFKKPCCPRLLLSAIWNTWFSASSSN